MSFQCGSDIELGERFSAYFYVEGRCWLGCWFYHEKLLCIIFDIFSGV